jgi:hypothetical protein
MLSMQIVITTPASRYNTPSRRSAFRADYILPIERALFDEKFHAIIVLTLRYL